MEESACPFCAIYENEKEEVLFETKFFFALTPLRPVNDGHLMLIPKRHVKTVFDINAVEMYDYALALSHSKRYLDERLHPDGYNIGVNCGEAGGQSVFHAHIHVVPRFAGDVPDTGGGIMRNLLQTAKPV